MKKLFGTLKDGREVFLYEIRNSQGMRAEVLDYGAMLVSLYAPDGNGKFSDVVLGYDKVSQYEVNDSFLGAVIAPNANRIAGASFEIDGVKYNIDVNDGPNNLHSHMDLASHKRIWNAKESDNSVSFSLDIGDMEMGFPGNKHFTITYTMTDDNGIELHYTANSDRNTIINPTNHAYFNLSGHACGKSILNHVLTLYASNYTPAAKGSIPTGEIAPVAGTVMDFTTGKQIGQDIDSDFFQIVNAGGFDHNFVVDNYDGSLRKIASVTDPESGRTMEAYSTLPGVQFYAGNFIGSQNGKGGAHYENRYGMCLESHFFPDSIHHDNFPSCVFGPGRDYESTTVYKFI